MLHGSHPAPRLMRYFLIMPLSQRYRALSLCLFLLLLHPFLICLQCELCFFPVGALVLILFLFTRLRYCYYRSLLSPFLPSSTSPPSLQPQPTHSSQYYNTPSPLRPLLPPLPPSDHRYPATKVVDAAKSTHDTSLTHEESTCKLNTHYVRLL